MGKKSLIKSTTKKKSSAKEGEEKAAKKTVTKTTKKAAPKSTKKSTAKTTKKAAAKTTKKAAAKKKAAPKKTAAKKAPAKKATTAKPKAAPKKTTKKAAPKKVSIKALLFKKFEPMQPAAEPMAAPKQTISDISAPPLIDSKDPKEIKRLQALLFNKFDMDEVKAAAKAPAPQPKPKAEPKPAKKAAPAKKKPVKKVTVQELIFKKFEAFQAVPVQKTVQPPTASDVTAPPLISSTDPKEVERQKALLFAKFDMNEIKAAAKEPEPVPAPAPEVEAAEPPATPEGPAEEKAYITMDDSGDNGQTTMSQPLKIAIAVAAAVIFLMLAISYNNGSKYYIQEKEGAIEIWKGRFSPKDTKFFMTLEGVELPEPPKEIYAKAEVFPMILDYYVDKADTLLEVKGLPDLQGIKDQLLIAKKYIVTAEAKTAVTSRLNNIERLILLYKADVAISQNTEDSLESAIKLLKKADVLTTSTALSEEISAKITGAREQIVALETEAEQQAAEMEAAEEAERLKAEQEENAEALKAAPEGDAQAPADAAEEAHN